MHELSIAISLVDWAVEEAEYRRGMAKVTAIHLKLGPLAGVIEEALISAFEMARAGTVLEESTLVIKQVPVVLACPTCGRDQPAVSPREMACAVCGTITGDIVTGRELEVFALEVPQ